MLLTDNVNFDGEKRLVDGLEELLDFGAPGTCGLGEDEHLVGLDQLLDVLFDRLFVAVYWRHYCCLFVLLILLV